MINKIFAIIFFSFGIFIFADRALATNYNCTCSDLTEYVVTDCTSCNAKCVALSKGNSPVVMSSCALTGTIETVTTTTASPITLTNPLSVSTPQALIGKVIESILGVVGSIALLMFVFGGLTWMLSAGSPEKVKKGRDIIIWAAIGLVIIFLAYALVRFVLSTIAQ